MTCVSAELMLLGSSCSGVSQILLQGNFLKLSSTDGDAKRSFSMRLALVAFLSTKFYRYSITFDLFLAQGANILRVYQNDHTISGGFS